MIASFIKRCLGLICLFVFGCSQKTTVVLLSDPDGHIGNLSVASDGGTIEMNRVAESTIVSDRSKSPNKPKILSEQEVNSQFSVVLATLPTQPQHFLLYFQKGSTALTPDSEAILPQILQSIRTRKSKSVDVIGHSDTAGDPDFNLRLSKDRALAVSQVLIGTGVEQGYITITSHGEKNLLIKTADNVQEEKNRRVEVVVK